MTSVAIDLLSTGQHLMEFIRGKSKPELHLDFERHYTKNGLQYQANLFVSGSEPINIRDVEQTGHQCMNGMGFDICKNTHPSYMTENTRTTLYDIRFKNNTDTDTDLNEIFATALVKCEPKTRVYYKTQGALNTTQMKDFSWNKAY